MSGRVRYGSMTGKMGSTQTYGHTLCYGDVGAPSTRSFARCFSDRHVLVAADVCIDRHNPPTRD